MFDKDTIDRMGRATAYDTNGDKVGSVGQIYSDNDSGEPTFATVSTGLFGMSESFVPLRGARMDGDDLRLDYTKDQIKDAPRIDENGQLSPDEEDTLYSHYGLSGDRRTDRSTGTDRDHDHDRSAGTKTAAAGTAAAGRGTTDRDVDHDRDRDRDHDRTGDTDTVTAHEERLNVGTREEETGRVRLRKYTTSEKETVEVPVKKEKLVVEREDVDGTARRGGLDDIAEGDRDEEITLREERPVVEKETVESERVRVGKETVTDTEKVSTDVRKEHIDIDTDGKGKTDRGADRDTDRDADRRH